MRLCRFSEANQSHPAFFFDSHLIPLEAAAKFYRAHTRKEIVLPVTPNLLEYLPPAGKHFAAARELAGWLEKDTDAASQLAIDLAKARLLTPLARPPKLLLLAGNYAAHIEEGGGIAVERQRTFPYVFMKPLTTLNHPGAPIPVPASSPNHVDWEVELGVVMGRRARNVKAGDALGYVAGYTVVNDISDREFRPNPSRELRKNDSFFDWLHGKWHDGFCPVGPCIRSADSLPDPQQLRLTLKVNGETKQDATTAQQIFSVAAVIEFISNFVTLEPGDIIATGTPAGVGHTTGTYLKAGDRLEAAIAGIGALHNHMVKPKA